MIYFIKKIENLRIYCFLSFKDLCMCTRQTMKNNINTQFDIVSPDGEGSVYPTDSSLFNRASSSAIDVGCKDAGRGNNHTNETSILKVSSQPQLSQNHLMVLSSLDIFKCIIDYVNERAYYNTCQLLFKFKKKYVKYKLNINYSLMFKNDETFRATVLERISNQHKQLILNHNTTYCNITDVCAISNVYALDLSRCFHIRY